jgi:Leucine Rich repeat
MGRHFSLTLLAAILASALCASESPVLVNGASDLAALPVETRSLQFSPRRWEPGALATALARFDRLESLDISAIWFAQEPPDDAFASLKCTKTLRVMYLGYDGPSLATPFENLAELHCQGDGFSAADWRSLAALKNLEVLSAGHCRAKDDALEPLGKLLKLRVLEIKTGDEVTGEFLAAFRGHPALAELVLGFPKFKAENLAGLKALPALRRLGLYGSGGDSGTDWDAQLPVLWSLATIEDLELAPQSTKSIPAETWAGILALKRLKRLRICGLTGAEVRTLCQLASLQCLLLEYCEFTEADLAYLPNLTRLEELALPMDSDRGGMLAYVGKLTSLRKLSIHHDSWMGGMEAHPFDFECFKSLDPLQRLEELDLIYTRALDDTVAKHVSALKGLKRVILPMHCVFTEAGLASFASLPKLESFKLQYCKTTNEAAIAHLSRMTQVRELWLTQVSGVTSKALRSIGNLTKLDRLSIDGDIGDDTLVALASIKSLRDIWIRFAPLTGSGLEAFAGHPTLASLTLMNCAELKDSSLAFVAGIPGLAYLNVSKAVKLTDAGIENLLACKQLGGLSIDGCERIEGEGVEKLLEKFPDLQVDGYEPPPKYRAFNEDGSPRQIRIENRRQARALPKDVQRIEAFMITNDALEVIAGCAELRQLSVRSAFDLNDEAFAKLASLTKLERLHLEGCYRLTGQALRTLGSMKNLRSLTLERCVPLGEDDVAYLATLPLEQIGFTEVFLPADWARHLAASKTLLSISTWGSTRGARFEADALSALSDVKTLRRIRLCNYPEFGGAEVVALSKVTQLEDLYFNAKADISDEAFSQLGKLMRLKALDVCNCPYVTDAGFASLAALKDLEHVELSEIGKLGNSSLSVICNWTKLVSLNLDGFARVTDASALSKFKALESLSWTMSKWVDGKQAGTSLTDAHFVAIGTVTTLKRLNLGLSTSVTAKGLLALGKLTLLQSLQLNEVASSGEAFSFLAGLKHLNEFTYFGPMDDAALAHVGSATNLTYLHLQHCEKVTDAGLAPLGQLQQLENLSLLNPVGIDGKGLKALEKLSKLRCIDLAVEWVEDKLPDSKFCDEGLLMLKDLPALRWARIVGLKRITPEGMSEFYKQQTNECVLDSGH